MSRTTITYGPGPDPAVSIAIEVGRLIQARRWTVEIFVGEWDGVTFAEAALCDDTGNRTRGQGRARPDPLTPDRVGVDEIAVSRALDDLIRGLNRLDESDRASSVDGPAHAES